MEGDKFALDMADLDLMKGLSALPDAALDKVMAHLTARNPMCVEFGPNWGLPGDNPDTRPIGCLVGVSMTAKQFRAIVGSSLYKPEHPLFELAVNTFPEWVSQKAGPVWEAYYDAEDCEDEYSILPQAVMDRLALLIELEYKSRHYVTAKAEAPTEPVLVNV